MDANFLRQMQDMQRRAEALQKGMAALEVEGIASGGLVKVSLNGLGELKKLQIDPSLMAPSERQIVEELTVAAYANGRAKLESHRLQDSSFVQDLLKSFTGDPPRTD